MQLRSKATTSSESGRLAPPRWLRSCVTVGACTQIWGTRMPQHWMQWSTHLKSSYAKASLMESTTSGLQKLPSLASSEELRSLSIHGLAAQPILDLSELTFSTCTCTRNSDAKGSRENG